MLPSNEMRDYQSMKALTCNINLHCLLYSTDMSRRERSKDEEFEDTKGAFINHFTGYDHIEYLLIRYKRYDLCQYCTGEQVRGVISIRLGNI
jgi:hypothetical protein